MDSEQKEPFARLMPSVNENVAYIAQHMAVSDVGEPIEWGPYWTHPDEGDEDVRFPYRFDGWMEEIGSLADLTSNMFESAPDHGQALELFRVFATAAMDDEPADVLVGHLHTLATHLDGLARRELVARGDEDEPATGPFWLLQFASLSLLALRSIDLTFEARAAAEARQRQRDAAN